MHKEYILLNGFRKAKRGFTAGFHVPLMQEYVTVAAEWTDNNDMKINSEKLNEMIISYSRSNLGDEVPNILIEGRVVERVDHVKLLGITLSNDLTCTRHVDKGSALCSPVPMFPGTYVPRTYVPRYLCSPVPMFPGTDVPRTYVPRYLCSPVPMFAEPMFPGTYVPRFTANVL